MNGGWKPVVHPAGGYSLRPVKYAKRIHLFPTKINVIAWLSVCEENRQNNLECINN